MISTATTPFLIRFGDHAAGDTSPAALRLPLPVLGAAHAESLFPPGQSVGTGGAFALHQTGDWLLGCAFLPVGRSGMEAVARALYQDLLEAVRGRHLCRLWNYVPHINAHVDGQENYRAFCRGRALAFEAEYGVGQFARLCAASAVGTPEACLSVVFAAAADAPRHYENPAQTAAYRYPAEHGPYAPSFARATVSADGRMAFVSGTSAITGHASIGRGDTAAQVACTLDNLTLISRAAGLGPDLGAGIGHARHFKLYLRHAADFPVVAARLQDALLRPGDQIIWLQADICRAELNVEIEATLVAA